MKNVVFFGLLLLTLWACSNSKTITSVDPKNPKSKISDTVKIANEALEYEVIIIDPGFSSWIAGRARPRGFYSEAYLENKNSIYVREWNNRVLQPMRFNPNLYEMRIDYESNIHYGYEVNYLIYNYFIYFQITNKQKLAGFVPNP